jgi:hypothetical protein
MKQTFLLGIATLLAATGIGHSADARVDVAATPDGGIQPQAVVDAQGVLHLLYFKGRPGEGISSMSAASRARAASPQRFAAIASQGAPWPPAPSAADSWRWARAAGCMLPGTAREKLNRDCP